MDENWGYPHDKTDTSKIEFESHLTIVTTPTRQFPSVKLVFSNQRYLRPPGKLSKLHPTGAQDPILGHGIRDGNPARYLGHAHLSLG